MAKPLAIPSGNYLSLTNRRKTMLMSDHFRNLKRAYVMAKDFIPKGASAREYSPEVAAFRACKPDYHAMDDAWWNALVNFHKWIETFEKQEGIW